MELSKLLNRRFTKLNTTGLWFQALATKRDHRHISMAEKKNVKPSTSG